MFRDGRGSDDLDIIWIYSGCLTTALDAATWLKTAEELRKLGCRVTLVSAGKDGYQQVRGVRVLCISRPETYLLRQVVYHLRVVKYLLRQFTATDVVLFHEPAAPWVLPLRVFRRFSQRQRPLFVMDTRTVPMEPSERQTRKDKLRRWASACEMQLGNRVADGRLAITVRMSEAVHIPASRLWGIWSSGAESEHFAGAAGARAWPGPGESIQLIYHGAIHPERNLMTLCHAVMKANMEGMSFTLSLVGEGKQRAELARLAGHTDGVVRVLSAVPYDEIPELLARAHVGVLPFPDEEKFRVSSPIKLFEYMAAGMPILLTRIDCHTDVVGSGEYAFWAESSDEAGLLNALRTVWRSGDTLCKMGTEAAIASRAWTWTAAARKLKEALERGIEEREFRTMHHAADKQVALRPR